MSLASFALARSRLEKRLESLTMAKGSADERAQFVCCARFLALIGAASRRAQAAERPGKSKLN